MLYSKNDMEIKLDSTLPPYPKFVEGIRRAPSRGFRLTKSQVKIALMNALRYIPKSLHETLAPELLDELKTFGRIYGYRFRPDGWIRGKPISEYQGACVEGRAFQVMIDNNLDFDIALYPYELVTYGETGSVFQNWMQYILVKKYLEVLTQDQTLVIESGHPLGLFPSKPEAPRVIITNAMMVGMFDNPEDWEIAAEMGVANYGQMTAGGWMNVGPQGIVHETFITFLYAGRMQLGIPQGENLAGVLLVSSGLGSMGGAQPKAMEIAGGVGVIAEVDFGRIQGYIDKGWLSLYSDDLDKVFSIAHEYAYKRMPISIAYHGNIIDLLQYAVDHDIHIPILTDQTSCHEAYAGGYCPQGLTTQQRDKMLIKKPAEFRHLVDASLMTHYKLIKKLYDRGTYFFDYGNSFLKAIYDSGIKEISKNGINAKDGFIYPSYIEDIIGSHLFDSGYGSFRWVCLSGDPGDLDKTDQAVMECIDSNLQMQDHDNWLWFKNAQKYKLVVGTQARVLYLDAHNRTKITLEFNEMVRARKVKGPILVGRNHVDLSGTDSPFRETSNIKDGSNIMADMSVQCFAGNCARGMSLVSLHNGGGVGIGKAVNGGFGMVLDGSDRVARIVESALQWDVMGGVARRGWARNENAIEVCAKYNRDSAARGHITLPVIPDIGLVDKTISQALL
ncbi:MAG: urocanate hydratase [Oscillospiraceae bacterium]|nr:urocanate hydratase [Oscillospiraceae bacterium]